MYQKLVPILLCAVLGCPTQRPAGDTASRCKPECTASQVCVANESADPTCAPSCSQVGESCADGTQFGWCISVRGLLDGVSAGVTACAVCAGDCGECQQVEGATYFAAAVQCQAPPCDGECGCDPCVAPCTCIADDLCDDSCDCVDDPDCVPACGCGADDGTCDMACVCAEDPDCPIVIDTCGHDECAVTCDGSCDFPDDCVECPEDCAGTAQECVNCGDDTCQYGDCFADCGEACARDAPLTCDPPSPVACETRSCEAMIDCMDCPAACPPGSPGCMGGGACGGTGQPACPGDGGGCDGVDEPPCMGPCTDATFQMSDCYNPAPECTDGPAFAAQCSSVPGGGGGGGDPGGGGGGGGGAGSCGDPLVCEPATNECSMCAECGTAAARVACVGHCPCDDQTPSCPQDAATQRMCMCDSDCPAPG